MHGILCVQGDVSRRHRTYMINTEMMLHVFHREQKFANALGMMAMGAGTSQSRWRAGRDLWCRKCEVRYCLHCSDQLKKDVHWHHEKTCEEYILEIERSKNEAERQRKDREAVAQCVAISHSRQAHHHMHGFPSCAT
jgi:hypothetical protein